MAYRSALMLCLAAATGCAALDGASAGESDFADSIAQDCAEDHPANDDEVERAAADGNVVGDCLDDDGECQASIECTGTPEGRVCDPSRFIGEPAALCIARSHGQATGLRGLRANLGYNFGHRRATWEVVNVLAENGPAWQGEVFVIDAMTGELLDMNGIHATP